jgi:hypothetical protein
LRPVEHLQTAQDITSKQRELGEDDEGVDAGGFCADPAVEKACPAEIGLGAVELSLIKVKQAAIEDEPSFPDLVAVEPQAMEREGRICHNAAPCLRIRDERCPVDRHPVHLRPCSVTPRQLSKCCVDLTSCRSIPPTVVERHGQSASNKRSPAFIAVPLGGTNSRSHRSDSACVIAEHHLRPAEGMERSDLGLELALGACGCERTLR